MMLYNIVVFMFNKGVLIWLVLMPWHHWRWINYDTCVKLWHSKDYVVKGHWHEKIVSNKHVEDALGIKHEQF
jgi:hypothetical protein